MSNIFYFAFVGIIVVISLYIILKILIKKFNPEESKVKLYGVLQGMSNREIISISCSIISYIFTIYLMTSFIDIPDILRILIIVPATIIVFLVCLLAIRIEQVAGYYECPDCNYKYIPSYKSVLMATHVGRTRKMVCPKCKNKSWQKKITTK